MLPKYINAGCRDLWSLANAVISRLEALVNDEDTFTSRGPKRGAPGIMHGFNLSKAEYVIGTEGPEEPVEPEIPVRSSRLKGAPGVMRGLDLP